MITKTDELYLFWQTDSNLSNWTHTPFVYKGYTIPNSEIALMYEKAILMGDNEMAETIIVCGSPKIAKGLGRKVKNFDYEVWEPKRKDIMIDIAVEKALQHKPTFNELKDTGDRVIAEASPYDKIWGIGFAPNDPKALDMANWNGSNDLGFSWMEARNRIFD